ncbi:MAG: phosphohistidine phosphatase SixA [Candidatus Anammoxibacter sp.]
MEIYLVRHGTPYSEVEDPERRLSSKGLQQCQITGKALKLLHVNIDLIVSSPKIRAVQTAEIIAEMLEYAKENIKVTPTLEPNGFPLDVISFLKDHSAKTGILLAGHLPSLANIASELMSTGSLLSINFETSSVCRIDVDSVSSNTGSLRWFLTPEHLELIAK